MPEILRFKVTRAEAEVDAQGHLTVSCYYPRQPEVLSGRAPENLAYGISVFTQLLEHGYAPLADAENHFVPPSAGSIYQFSNGTIMSNRRDLGARVHKLYHSGYAGFPSSLDEIYTAEGLHRLALRESAEECLLVTRDKEPWLIVPNDSQEETLRSAKRIGLNLKRRYVKVETEEGTDTLNTFYEDGELLFTLHGSIDLGWESATFMDVLHLRRFPFSSEEVYPIDAEGVENQGRYQRFNRETYILKLEDLAHLAFGQPLPHPEVYQAEVREGQPHIYTRTYNKPFLGPEGVPAGHPHLFAPDNHIVRILDGLKVPRYKGKWMQIERWKEETKLAEKSLLDPVTQQRLEEIMDRN